MRSLIINYKAYAEGIDNGLEIAAIAKKMAKKTKVDIIVAPPLSLLPSTSRVVKSFSQSMGSLEPGPFTGHVTWYEIQKSGASGTLINHSENRINIEEISRTVNVCRRAGLLSVVCVRNMDEAAAIVGLNPDFIAYEPPELIGSNISVSTAKPETVREFCSFVRARSKSLPLVGAGIKTSADVAKSVELGSDGILVASGAIKADDLAKAIFDLARPLS